MAKPERDREVKRLYFEGKTRQEAMAACGITNTNTMASISTRLRLHWSWPLENRKNGEVPSGGKVVRTTPFRGRGFSKQFGSSFEDTSVPETIPNTRQLPPLGLLSSREKRLQGFLSSDTDLGGRLSPFPTPREVSGNPKDLSRAEIHAFASYYR